MKSTQTLLLAFVMFGLIGSVNFDFPYSDELGMHINARNDGDDDLRRLYGFDDNQPVPGDEENIEGVQVRAFIADLGIMAASQSFDLDHRDMRAKWLYVYDSADLCDEWVRISVSNDEVRRTKYRQIIC